MDQINPYASNPVADYPVDTRSEFIRKTYMHLAGAIGAFAVLEALMLKAGLGDTALALIGTGKYSWLMVLGTRGSWSSADSWSSAGLPLDSPPVPPP